ncbi:hypothetical protein ACFL2D_01885 [Patescibacteria group bacterium]
MKKIWQYLVGASSTAYLLLQAKLAAAITIPGGEIEGVRQENDILPIVFDVINWILIITGAFAILMLIIGGFRYITSAGNDKQVQAAKTTMTYAIVGLVIVLLSYVIAATINSILVGD